MVVLWFTLIYNIFMDIEELFYKNYTNKEIANALGCSLSTVKRRLTKKGLNRSKAQKGMILSRVVKQAVDSGRKTYLYGDDNPARKPEVRKKISEGVTRSMPVIVEKRRQTLLEKYGVENSSQIDGVSAKIKKTNLKRYGYDSPARCPDIIAQRSMTIKKTLATKYDHEQRILDLKKEYVRLGRKLTPKEMIKLWGCSQSNAYIFLHNNNLEDYVFLGSSRLENSVENFLKAYGINYQKNTRRIITPQELDFYIPEFNLAIEVNDSWSHNSTRNTFGSSPKDKTYHYKKSVRCEENGIRLIHVWEYEWENERQRAILQSIILGACNQSTSIYARKCNIEVVESKSMKRFFEENNIQGFRGGRFAINLVYEGEVVMSYIMGHPFFGKGKYEWEVIRGATKVGYRVIGGASKIWKYFLREYKPKSCVYYIDYNYFNGNSVEKLGLKYIGVKPSFKNYFVKEKKIRNRQPSKHKEIKALVEQGKVWEIYNAGVKVYLYESDVSK